MTASFTLTVDTVASSVPSIDAAMDDVGAKQGALASGDVTDDPTPTLSGSGTAGDKINVYDGNELIGSTTVDRNGHWSYTVPALTTEGVHPLSTTSVDAAGNESARSPEFIVILDTTAPDVSNASN